MARLRYLRGMWGRRQRRVRMVRVALAALVLVCGNSLGRTSAARFKVADIVVPAHGRELDQPWAGLTGSAITKAATTQAAKIWVVEETAASTLYSNGLTIRREFEAESVPRRYRTYRRDTLARSEVQRAPIGIVFHSSESLILPLEPGQNSGLLRSREDTLEHARRGRLYNFLIDRFGQVSRIVPEDQTALHAGHSVWASGDSVWVDLNESFLGVSFEAESAGAFEPSAAQVHAGRLLTQVLRSRFAIPEENCVTHAQVSVNPDNMRIGYHTDWGSTFPFQGLGLPENYTLPVAAVAVFGFQHDDAFLHAIGDRAWPGLQLADAELKALAAKEGLTANEFAGRLQQLYRTLRRQRNG